MFKKLFGGLIKAIGNLLFGKDGHHGLLGPILTLLTTIISTAISAISGVFQNIVMWVIDLLMNLIFLILNSLGLTKLHSNISWSHFGDSNAAQHMLTMLHELNFFTAMGIITIAIFIRIMIKIIPFVS